MERKRKLAVLAVLALVLTFATCFIGLAVSKGNTAEAVPLLNVTVPTNDAYGITPLSGEMRVAYGESFGFEVTLNPGYKKTAYFGVQVNAESITPQFDGSYLIESVTTDIEITAGGYEKCVYSVLVPDTAYRIGYELEPLTDKRTFYYGDSYSFRLTLSDGYIEGDNFAVVANDTVLTGTNGVYEVASITCNQSIVIVGVEIKKHTVSYPLSEAYDLVNPDYPSIKLPASKTVNHFGESIFKVIFHDGYYEGENFVVRYNGTIIHKNGGNNYYLKDIREDVEFTIEGVEYSAYDVASEDGEGYGIDCSASSVLHGGAYTISVSLDEGYIKTNNFAVMVNGSAITAVNGVYKVSNVRANQNVTVRGVELSRYSLTLPTVQTGYTLEEKDGLTSVDYNGGYTLQFALKEGYTDSVCYVKVNGAVASVVNGEIVLANVKTNLNVEVSGITKNKYTVCFSGLSNATPSYIGAATVVYGNAYTPTTAVTKRGYAFTGWQYDLDGETHKVDGTVAASVFMGLDALDEKGIILNATFKAAVPEIVSKESYGGAYDGETHRVGVTVNEDQIIEAISYCWYKGSVDAKNEIGVYDAAFFVSNVKESGSYVCVVTVYYDTPVVLKDSVSVAITKAAISVSANSKTVKEGTDAALTYNVAGTLYNGATVNGELARVAGTKPGDYQIKQGTVKVSDEDNYQLTYVGASYRILPTDLTNSNDKIKAELNAEYGLAAGAKFTVSEAQTTTISVPSGVQSKMYKSALTVGDTALALEQTSVIKIALPDDFAETAKLNVLVFEGGKQVIKSAAVTDGYIVFSVKETGEFVVVATNDGSTPSSVQAPGSNGFDYTWVIVGGIIAVVVLLAGLIIAKMKIH